LTTLTSAVLEVDGLSVSYKLGRKYVRAICDSSLRVDAREAVGLVGESGSGKSSLARAVLGLLPPKIATIDAGRILIDGIDVTRSDRDGWERIRGNPIAIVFQDPLSYLNPVMRIGNQIAETVLRHDSTNHVRSRVEELLSLVKLPLACAGSFPHELSGGMRQRVLLAIALGCRPRLLIADEPTTALDVTTQAEILALLNELREKLDMALLLISHDLAVIEALCSRIYVMYAGRTIEWGSTDAVFNAAAHPYTQALLQSAKVLQNDDGLFITIKGNAPTTGEQVEGCPLMPRCDRAIERCSREMPQPVAMKDSPGHYTRCWVCS
jgi:oligopeptide/dipeptide ABC transporter ATP-binding protein